MRSERDTIAAIATPLGKGAIGVVRMSGGRSRDILKKVWKSSRHPVDKFKTHRIYLGNIIEQSTGRHIDEVLVLFMAGPNSYTGEDVIEISCHGGIYVTRRILEELLLAGARCAEPGEFTKRAFLNGKLDLVEAEAVVAIIESEGERALRAAMEQLKGGLSKEIDGLIDRTKEVLAILEASIDFPEEEDIRFIDEADVAGRIDRLIGEIELLLDTARFGRLIKDGVKTVIVGPPNAGKSSLLNRLLGFERAIVHHTPGTTRDTIEERMEVDGITIRLIDTAGIREAMNEVEEIGISRSREEASSAEIVIVVLDGHSYIPLEEEFLKGLCKVGSLIVVINKSDLGIKEEVRREVGRLFSGRKILEVSAIKGDGIDDLFGAIKDEIRRDMDGASEVAVITSERHKNLLTEAVAALKEGRKSLSEGIEFAAEHVRRVLHHIGEITGAVYNEQVLDEIFGRFCIGK